MRYRIGLIAALLIVAAAGLAVAQTTTSIQGVWRVTEVVVTGADAETNKSPQPGLYMFGKQHYSIVTISGTAPRKDFGNAANAAKLTDAEKIARFAAWDALTANSGTYQVSGTTLTTHPMVAKNPAVMGSTATREFKIDGKTLTLVQKSAPGQPASQTTTRLTRLE